MIGLDTNVILRYLLQDDPVQSRAANRFVEGLEPDRSGFINLVTVLEIVWVLRSFFKLKPTEIAEHLEHLLSADSLRVQNEQEVFEATFVLKRGLGEFEDALIGALDRWAGCTETVTFDRGTSKLMTFRLLT